MTWLQIALSAFLIAALVVAWSRYSVEKGPLRSVAELYLWLLPGVLAWLPPTHDRAGLRVTAIAGSLYLLLAVTSLLLLGARPTARVPAPAGATARFAGFLLISGSAMVWLGAVTFRSMDLASIAARRSDHLFTTVFFMLGALFTLAGFTALTALLRESGTSVFAELGLVVFLFGSVCWAIHLAFRAVVMVSAAEETLVSGAAPSWYPTWRLFGGVMFGFYMTAAYLATAAYGSALLSSGWAGKGWGRVFVAFGLVAAAGFLTVRAFGPPLLAQFMPYAMGLILLRRSDRK
ncbi:MAG TPA: hypothetical protein VJ810_18795 [Blastocatellia bacterium]|nr:hypothetical protein [Blastocatellia bacterium]